MSFTFGFGDEEKPDDADECTDPGSTALSSVQKQTVIITPKSHTLDDMVSSLGLRVSILSFSPRYPDVFGSKSKS